MNGRAVTPIQRNRSLLAGNGGLTGAEQPAMPPADAQQAADDVVMLAFARGWQLGLEAGAERGTAA